MVKYIDKVVPDTFHGTSKTIAEHIVRTKKFIPSSGEDCFLGDGIYFFEAGKERAKWWARRRYRGQQIGIIIAVIQLGRCLDLSDPTHVELVKLTEREIEKTNVAKKITDTLVINFLTNKIDKEIETVRGYFPGYYAEKIFEGSRIYQYLHVVICVKRQENILTFNLI
jgi:hypothetical protein